ncbi:gamma-glutamyltransferase [Aestuariivirga litoralis]|uniref:gamma-glutamyltransferase n=1 Tax=Aestuariivirga litoralis TaxID=2650924 RepID=UPI0018C45F3E|nr:gamma-glutamyltransferase [Aestuariivirga litoralis]MBG1232065.1 gamma-glutamyltransferase [Aestuariivirga litoralis]
MRHPLHFLFRTAFILSLTITTAVTRAPVAADKGMVVTSQHLASDVGLNILKAGGNAVDAAVAVGYALAVTNPCCGNIGGGGFATLHLADGRDIFLNFREKAPLAATEKMYLDDKGEVKKDASLVGYLAAGVPGTVLGLDTLLSKYGTMKRADVMAPAIKLANDGFTLDQGDVDILALGSKDFVIQSNVAEVFLNAGNPWKAGDTLVQKKLGASLQQISDTGPDAFYKGPIADAVVAASQAGGGVFSKKDFEDYTVEELAPVKCTYRSLEVISSPPPSSGGTTICEILNILEGYPIHDMGFHSAASVHVMAEAMRHAYVDRNFSLGDPDFVKNPVDRLTSKDYAAAIRTTIDPMKATASADLKPGTPPHEGTQTTHFSIVDAAGNAVSITYTINGYFGARVMAGDTGFFLNDEMDDFTVKPGVPNLFGLVQGSTNVIAPGKRPLSSMSPTIVKKDGKVYMVLGSPGGSRIITIVLEAILNVVDHGMTIQEAVDAPRIHHQWLPDQISAEPFAFSADTAKILTDMGYKLVEQTPWGAAESILIGPQPEASTTQSSGNDAMAGGKPIPGKYYGAHDDRRSAGAAVGY